MARVIKSDDSSRGECAPFEREALSLLHADMLAEDGTLVLSPTQILENAEARAEQILADAYADGLQQGTEAGTAAFLETVANCSRALENAAEAIRRAREEYLQAIEPEVLRLVQAILTRILHREAKGDMDVVRATIRIALSNLLDREHATVYLNPGDLALLQQHGINILTESSGVDRMEVVPDEAVGPGGCIVETRALTVDARLDTQLQRILDALNG